MKPGVYFKNVTWDDAPHLDHDQKARLMASYPAHMRDARTKGIPMLGSGAVFPVAQQDIEVDPFDIPRHWAQISAVDFGIAEEHPFAAVCMAWDRGADALYVTACYRKSHETPVYHAKVLKSWGEWIPIAWPHDGMNRDKGSGRPLFKLYRAEGLKMLPESARYEDDKGGGQGSEPAVLEILERMRTGRFRVFKNLGDWFGEFRVYHRDDGLIVARNDDLMKATQYAVMMKRKAQVKTLERQVKAPYSRPIISGLG